MSDAWSGWEEHRNKEGTPCAYCGATSVRTLVVEPDEYNGRGELKRRGKRVGLCDTCTPQTSEDSAPSVHFRRRRTVADQLRWEIGVQDTNAIHKR
jgi:hypothetical protein